MDNILHCQVYKIRLRNKLHSNSETNDLVTSVVCNCNFDRCIESLLRSIHFSIDIGLINDLEQVY